MIKDEMKILIGLHRAVNEVDRKTAKIAATYGLTFSQFAALETLYSKGDMTIGELQNKILSSTGTIPLIIKHLTEKSYIEREIDSSDKRRCILHLTKILKFYSRKLLLRLKEWLKKCHPHLICSLLVLF